MESLWWWVLALTETTVTFLNAPPSDPGRPRVEFSLMDPQVAAKLAAVLGTVAREKYRKDARPTWSKLYCVRLSGGRAAQFMRSTYPYLSKRKQEAVDRVHFPQVQQPFLLQPTCSHPTCAGAPDCQEAHDYT